ncbi:MAG TPA: class I SAM-dependent methyltransferase [Cytophagaceae bacterium]
MSNKTYYEEAQSFNFLTRWLHSYRYKAIIQVFKELESKVGAETPIKVLEIGSAHGKLYELLNSQFNIQYTGIELYKDLYLTSLERYGKNSNIRLINGSALDENVYEGVEQPDIVVALETLEHILERDVFRLIEKIVALNPKLFVCSVPVEIGPSIWFKNIGSFLVGYSRHKEYTWKETFWAGLNKLDKLPPHDYGHKGFNWQWLAQTLRHYLSIKKTIYFPFNFLPSGLSTSVFFITSYRD